MSGEPSETGDPGGATRPPGSDQNDVLDGGAGQQEMPKEQSVVKSGKSPSSMWGWLSTKKSSSGEVKEAAQEPEPEDGPGGPEDLFNQFDEEHPVIDGFLGKAGKIPDGNFRERYLKVTPKFISYSVHKDSRPIDLIHFADIAGVTFEGIKNSPEIETWFRTGEEYSWERDHALALKLKNNEFVICTTRDGYHSGRQFLLSCESHQEVEKWCESVARVLKAHANLPSAKISVLSRIRRKVRWAYIGDRFQVMLACLIMLNFLVNICEAQFKSNTPGEASVFDTFNLVFTVIFTVEIVINLFSTLLWEFISDAWNWFDLTVVLVSLLSLSMTDLPGAQVLKLMRCFRVFRLFKRIPSLRQIIVALYSSIPPMANAFALVCMVTAIYAIMAVTFFSHVAEDEFGDFFKSMFTMFQVMTGDAWSNIARQLFIGNAQDAGVAVFFVSFQLIVALVLVNVVIAVLLDEFSKAAEKKNASSTSQGLDHGQRDPLERLVQGLSIYKDNLDFEMQVLAVYEKVVKGALAEKEQKALHLANLKSQAGPKVSSFRQDRRSSLLGHTGSMVSMPIEGVFTSANLSYNQLRDGLKKLDYIPPIFIFPEHWNDMVLDKGIANVDGKIGANGFLYMIRESMRRYNMCQLDSAMQDSQNLDGWNPTGIKSLVAGVKGLLVEEDAAFKRDVAAREQSVSAGGLGAGASEGDMHVHVLLKKLAAEVNLMHERLDMFESKGSNNGPAPVGRNENSGKKVSPERRSASKLSKASSDEKVKSGPSKRDSPPVKEAVREEMEFGRGNSNSGPVPAASLPTTARSKNSRTKSPGRFTPVSNLSQTFLKRKAGDRRKELSQLSGRSDEGMTSSRALSQRGPRQEELIGQGWNFFQSNFFESRTLSPPPQKEQDQNLLGGFFGGVTDGLGALGSTVMGSPPPMAASGQERAVKAPVAP